MPTLFPFLSRSVLRHFYPKLCLICDAVAPAPEEDLCTNCQVRLAKTDLHLERENIFVERFAGRIPLHAAAAMFTFRKGGGVQRLVHAFKYEGQRDLGYRLARRYGWELSDQAHFRDVDALIPVPLHPRKLRSRGYNQAKVLADGLSEGLKVPVVEAIVRQKHTASQTKKGRMARMNALQEIFAVENADQFAGKHILLVDDVLTTGATLEACAQHFLKVPNLRISMVALAIAEI